MARIDICILIYVFQIWMSLKIYSLCKWKQMEWKKKYGNKELYHLGYLSGTHIK